MTCTHQWHDATSSAGPERVCAKCKTTYTESRKAAPATKRGWVDLQEVDIMVESRHWSHPEAFINGVKWAQVELKAKNT